MLGEGLLCWQAHFRWVLCILFLLVLILVRCNPTLIGSITFQCRIMVSLLLLPLLPPSFPSFLSSFVSSFPSLNPRGKRGRLRDGVSQKNFFFPVLPTLLQGFYFKVSSFQFNYCFISNQKLTELHNHLYSSFRSIVFLTVICHIDPFNYWVPPHVFVLFHFSVRELITNILVIH